MTYQPGNFSACSSLSAEQFTAIQAELNRAKTGLASAQDRNLRLATQMYRDDIARIEARMARLWGAV